jgi:hypothetical protein
LPEYSQPDYRHLKYDINPSSREGDSGFENSYFGRTAHPYESIFIKTSRNIYSDQYLKQLAWSMSINNLAEKSIGDSATIQEYLLSCEKSVSISRQDLEQKTFWKNVFQNR